MLRIIQSDHQGSAQRYFDDALSQGDYYADGGEIPGRWGGKGAERLGLTGEVAREAFHNLCRNFLPDGSSPLTVRTKANRRVGYDKNFHCPKSASVLHAWGDERILEAFRAAYGETMLLMEADAKTRVRIGTSRGERTTSNLVWAEFLHTTARPVNGIPDPHLHCHCFTFNATFDPVEGRWKAAEFGDLKRNAGFYEAVFQARFASLLTELGYVIEPKGKFWEVAGVPDSVIRKFSNRTAEVEQAAKLRGVDDPGKKAELGARTRRAKSRSRSWAEIRSEWQARLTEPERKALLLARKGQESSNGKVHAKEAFDLSIAQSFEQASLVSEKKVLERALRYGLGHVGIEELRVLLAGRDFVLKEIDGERFVTTAELLRREKEIIAFAKEGRETCKPIAGDELASLCNGLSSQQKAVAQTLLTSSDRVVGFRMDDGTAKASILKTTCKAIEEAGLKVVVLSDKPIGAITSDGKNSPHVVSVGQFLGNQDSQGKATGGVIWVEHAGRLGVKSLEKLFSAARHVSARLILSESVRPFATVERGDTLRLLEEYAGVRSAEISTIRQKRDAFRAAMADFWKGRLSNAFRRIEKLGGIKEVSSGKIAQEATKEYARAVREKKKVVILAQRGGEKISDSVRTFLRLAGRLKGRRTFEKLDRLHGTCGRGDVVIFFKSVKGFKAGHRYKVLGRDPRGRIMAREGSWIEALPGDCEHYAFFRKSKIQIARGDVIRTTFGGRTKNETFGIEKLMSKRGRAIRLANHKLFGIKTPDRRYRVPGGHIDQVTGFTVDGDVKLANGWILPKTFGHWSHGYCVSQEDFLSKHSMERVIVIADREERNKTEQVKRQVSPKGVESVTVFTDDKDGLLRQEANDSFRQKENGDNKAVAAIHRAYQQSRARQKQEERVFERQPV